MDFKNQKVVPGAEPFFFPGDSTACLLVHGFTGSPKEMRPLGDYLNRQGHTVLGVRLAGHATSPADMVRTRWEDWLLSIEDGLHLLRDAYSRVFLMGLSMGGMLSTIAAARFPVDALVMLSTPYELPHDWRMSLLPILGFFVPEIDKGESDWHNPENAKEHFSYPKYPTPSIGELSKVVDEMRQAEPRVKVPVLLVQSSGDGTVPADHAQRHYDNLGSGQKEILMVKNSGHIVTRDSEREAVFEKVKQFIDTTGA